MMHRKSGRKLGVTASHRKAMMANLCSSLIIHKRVETTLMRAKELRRLADHMITLGKRTSIHAQRLARRLLRNSRAVRIIFEELAPQFADRRGGYTRIMKLGYRRGDSSPMAIIEYVMGGLKSEKMPEKKMEKKEVKGKKEGSPTESTHKEKAKSKRKTDADASAARKKATAKSLKTKNVERGISPKRERKTGRKKAKD